MSWWIYGANGYTGELIARHAAALGLRPTLAGRNAEAVEAMARELDLPSRIAPLDDGAGLAAALAGVDAVLHCAGPFVRTSRAMVDACLAAGTHYLDITGEIAVFEAIHRRRHEAERAGVVLLPGAGFDVVPTDCLAARLAAALTGATHLELAFINERGGTSRGTLKTLVEGLPHLGAVRRDGRIVPVPLAWDAKEIEFGCGRRWAMTIPWGDLSTAFHTTGIRDIRVYTGMPPKVIRRLRRLRPLLPLLGLKPVKRMLQRSIERWVTGPDADQRATARIHLWGEVRNGAGDRRTATLETPEGYSFTAVSAVECVRRVLAGGVEPGAWTPARAFGDGFVTELPGVVAGELRSASE